MKKLKPPADGPAPGASIIDNADKISLFRDVRLSANDVVRKQVAAGRRIPQILADIGDEFVVSDRFGPDPMPKLEAVLRVVYDMALDGNLWCVDFIANRMEGRPMQSVVVQQFRGSVQDVPTEELLAYRDAEALNRLVEIRARQLIASGAVLPASSE